MTIKLAVPLIFIVTISLGCYQLRTMSNTAADGNTSEIESASTSDPAPAPAEFAPSGDPKADIEKLADRFMTVKSFKAKMNGEGQTPMRTELDFVAPDRYRIKTANGIDMVVIGRSTYMQIGNKWQKMDLPLENSIADIRAAFNNEAMKWVSDVRYAGDDTVNGKSVYVYTFHGKGPNNIGENDSKLWIAKSDGLPIKMEAVYKSGNLKSMIIEYDYETAVSIEPSVS